MHGLVFNADTGASIKMAKPRGRANRGKRCRAAVLLGHWETTTFTNTLRVARITARVVPDRPMNRVAF